MSRSCLTRKRSRYQSLAEHGFAHGTAREFREPPLPSLIVAVRHDVQQRLERRTSRLHAAVFKVLKRHAPLRLHDGVDAGREQFQVLLLRPQHLAGEDGAGRFEDAAEEMIHEEGSDAVAQAAGQNACARSSARSSTFSRNPLLDQKLRIALRHAHPAPDLRNQQADVVIHANVRTHVTGRRREAGVLRSGSRTPARC